MKQKEFEELSKKEVKELNGGDESAQEAWRAGYIYVQQQIKKLKNHLLAWKIILINWKNYLTKT